MLELHNITVTLGDRAAVGQLLVDLDERAERLGAKVRTYRNFYSVSAVTWAGTIRIERTSPSLVKAIEQALDEFERYVYTAEELLQIARQSV